MSVKNPMRMLHMGCGESLSQALPPPPPRPLLEAKQKPLQPAAASKPRVRKSR